VLLMSAPVSAWAVTAAKFFAALSVFTAALVISLLYPVILCLFGTPSWREVLAGYLGLFLFGMAVISVGLFVSSLMRRARAALLSVLGIMLFIMLIDSAVSWMEAGFIKSVVLWAAPLSNGAYFINGFLNLPSVVYFISVTALFLFLTMRSLEHAKWSKGRRT
jgi:ABC-2 type transport system permease protein